MNIMNSFLLLVFAWEAGERGVDVHLQADPTRLELLQKSFDVRKDNFKTSQQNSVLEKYGGLEHLNAPPKELLLAQTVNNLFLLLNHS